MIYVRALGDDWSLFIPRARTARLAKGPTVKMTKASPTLDPI